MNHLGRLDTALLDVLGWARPLPTVVNLCLEAPAGSELKVGWDLMSVDEISQDTCFSSWPLWSLLGITPYPVLFPALATKAFPSTLPTSGQCQDICRPRRKPKDRARPWELSPRADGPGQPAMGPRSLIVAGE